MSWDWLTPQLSAALGDLGIVAGLFYTGFGFWRDARIRRAEIIAHVVLLGSGLMVWP
jgi:hypothetical protein